MRLIYPSHRSSGPWTAFLGSVLLVAVSSAAAADTSQGNALRQADKSPVRTHDVQVIQDAPYYEGPGADKRRHKLDLYVPKGLRDFPVILFIHGGAWTHGDKNFLGLHKPIAMFWASRGFGTVMINYRLSPAVRHPEHVKDVARAFAWTHKNIGSYGGNTDAIFVCGHSAGGHLAALLATDDRYLTAEKLPLSAIKGVICISGVYKIPDDNALFDRVFGTDAKIREAASPLAHARSDAPPFLIIYADGDLVICGKKPSEEFCRALRAKNASVRSFEAKKRTHISVFFKAKADDDPVFQAIREFIRTYSAEQRAEGSKQ